MSLINTDLFLHRASALAKELTPYRDGQLVTSFTGTKLENGIKLNWNGALAPHGIILEKADSVGRTSVPNIHKGWASIKVYDAMGGLINSMQNGTFNEQEFAHTYDNAQGKKYNKRAMVRMLQAVGSVAL